MTNEVVNMLFDENLEDRTKNQSYKDRVEVYTLPDYYYLVDMFNKQKELQNFLGERGKTKRFPYHMEDVRQPDVQLAIYHLFCMQIEYRELEVELSRMVNKEEGAEIDAKFELIDMFFFMFNVGIYTGIDIQHVVEIYSNMCRESDKKISVTNTSAIDTAITKYLFDYIDELPWKAWKEYDYEIRKGMSEIVSKYAYALYNMVGYANEALGLELADLYNLYMNKWQENRRRQMNPELGYVSQSH